MARVFNISINPSRLSIDHRALKIPQSFFKKFPESFFRLSFGARRSYIPLTIMATSLQSKFSKSANYIPDTQPAKEVLEIWRSADAVCFDVDSTVCLHEGIDELADFCGAGKAVSEWTTKAMSGSVPFEEALAARLSLFSPSLSQLQCFLDERPPRLSPGIAELINKLKTSNIDVYLISGGFRQMIKPVAVQLEIPLENIFANQLLFGSSGEFLGFDPTEFTSRSGGKAVAVQHIRKVHGYKSLIMIGDGATDLEARMPGGADLFICYGGVLLREAVAAKADWVVLSFEDLLTALK
ncbi:phosphoserine phosphatase, chloroplastic [Phalaenopsis equestris]|uniref:phosphoserine phosphatase, chloroplastic n=1 Tax=Phalaenopsis equestris TaxID=78828 RepID=UPI0009E3A283|nr:phosphoserine phosphatase, chloroplastic [Phalaenopsis equestris]XP_020579690.1 phosphoserine phosphatase, chloroplastic [Phalaenopsis equestris]